MIDALHHMNMLFVLFRTGAFSASVKRDPTCWAPSPRVHEAYGGTAPAARMAVRCALCTHWCDTGQDVQLYEWNPQCVCRACFQDVSDTFMGAFLPMMVASVTLELPPYWLNRVFRDWLYGRYLWDEGERTLARVRRYAEEERRRIREQDPEDYEGSPWLAARRRYNKLSGPDVPALDGSLKYRKDIFAHPDFETVCEVKVKDETPPQATTRGPVPRNTPARWTRRV